MKASYLFAPERYNFGNNKCFFCGVLCGTEYLRVDHVKDSFTNRDIVANPESEYVCGCCVASIGQGDDEIEMINGDMKKRKNSRGMQPRMYSWVLTKDKKLAATKEHITELRNVILTPPSPPFAIVLADSGQKQLLFRAPITYDSTIFPVMLEEEIIIVNKKDLKTAIDAATKICAAIGKRSLLECKTISCAILCEKYYGNIYALQEWTKIYSSSKGQLAAWLCKNKEEAQNEYPECRRI